MNIIDIFILLFFISALVRGVELGVVRQVSSTAGLFAGLFLGVYVQGKLISLATTVEAKALLALLVILGAVALCMSLSETVGAMLKQRIEHARLRGINHADRIFGSCVAGVTLLLAVWLGAAIFSNTPVGGLEKQLKSSMIIAELNKNLPPAPELVTRLSHLIDPNGFPNVFTGLEPNINTDRPLPSIGELDMAVQTARASTVRIEGEGCGGRSQGSGFVADTDLVITNAHVVAGVKRPHIRDGNGRHPAQVLGFNPDLDIAILRADHLAGKPLKLDSGIVSSGTASAVLGYPGGGDFTPQPASVIESFKAVGHDIYNRGETIREVYSIKSTVRPGNSGGPLVDREGEVIGVIFAESTTYDDVGYALTMNKVIDNLTAAKTRNQVVTTGSCAQ